MKLWVAIMFALTLSLDSFWVGVAYGLKGIRTPWYSQAVISGASVVMVLFSMSAGSVVGR